MRDVRHEFAPHILELLDPRDVMNHEHGAGRRAQLGAKRRRADRELAARRCLGSIERDFTRLRLAGPQSLARELLDGRLAQRGQKRLADRRLFKPEHPEERRVHHLDGVLEIDDGDAFDHAAENSQPVKLLLARLPP